MSVRTLHFSRAAAENHARQLANLTARPIFWGQHPLLKRGWLVEIAPTGDPDELVVLTLPEYAARRRPTWPAQVLEAYQRLQDQAETASPARREGLADLMQALLDRTGFTANDLDAMTPGAPKPLDLTRGKRGRPRLTTLTPHTVPERSRVSVVFTDLEETP